MVAAKIGAGGERGLPEAGAALIERAGADQAVAAPAAAGADEAMVFKLVLAASKAWRRLKGENRLPTVIPGNRCFGVPPEPAHACQVEAMAGYGITSKDIALVLGIDRDDRERDLPAGT